MSAWTDDVALAADALAAASGYLLQGHRNATEFGSAKTALLLIEQAEGEMERATRFLAIARRGAVHDLAA